METIVVCARRPLLASTVNWLLTFARAIHASIVAHARPMLMDILAIVCLVLREFDASRPLTIAARIHATTMVCAIACPVDTRVHVWPDLQVRFVRLPSTIVAQTHVIMVVHA